MTAGGIIPDDDVPALKAAGVAAVFGPGTTIAEVADVPPGERPTARVAWRRRRPDRHAAARAASSRDAALAGDRRSLARLLTAVENRTPVAEAALRRLYPTAGRAHLVGITGPPGSGKSTLVSALIARGPPRRAARWRSSRSTRRARSPAGRSSATASGCRPMPAIATSSSARWRRAATPAGWRRRRARRAPSSTRPASTSSSSRPSGPARARSRSRPRPTRRSSSRRPRWATRSRRSRPACSRSPTSWSSTRATGPVPQRTASPAPGDARGRAGRRRRGERRRRVSSAARSARRS